MTTAKNYATILEGIKNKLITNKMSALVGAGFSKNFNNDIFPSWWQLLRDMVNETRGRGIKEQFDKLPKNKGKSKLIYDEYLNQIIDQHIDEIGPLRVVSNYIKKKGYREAADYRIEQATPVIEIEDQDRFITYTEKGTSVTRKVMPHEMKIHEKFVTLPWNNIYTTNYDNLLESSIDATVKTQFDEKVTELRSQLTALSDSFDKKVQEIEKLKSSLPVTPDKESNINFAEKEPISDGSSDSPNFQELRNKLNSEEWALVTLREKRESIDKDLRKFERLQNDFNSLVVHSSDLALKKNGNIIKIHGSVRTKKERDYGFDSDIRKHYVISQEDFDTYPEKHEAFTQLMRISLLQESFCIIGFSGIDPNFLAWIDWVRDIIERKPGRVASKDKIYLIDVDKEPFYADRELFYANHGITVLPLRDPECIRFLEKQTERKLDSVDPNTRDIIELLIDYLGKDSPPSKFKIAYQLTKQQDYKELLRNVPNFFEKGKSEKKNLDVIKSADKISALRQYNRIPNHDWMGERNKYFYIRSADHYFSKLKKANKVNHLNLLICLIADQQIPISILFYDLDHVHQKLKNASKKIDEGMYHQLLMFELKEAVWQNNIKNFDKLLPILKQSNNPEILQEIPYQQCLIALYNLNFTNLYLILEEWKPKNGWILKKAGLIALSEPLKALKLIKSNIQEDLQEHLYQLERMVLFSLGQISSERSVYFDKVKKLEDQGLTSSRETVKQLLESLNKEKKEIIPYGYNKFNISETITFGGESKFLQSIQLFNYMIEVGMPISVPNVRQFSAKEIHTAFESTFNTYPYAILLFLSQYNDEKLTLKLAQDYSYSDDIFNQHHLISETIKKGYLDHKTPYFIKKNLLVFYSEFINVLRPTLWEDFFITVWQNEKENKQLFIERASNKNHFIKNALRFISRPSTAQIVINDSIAAITDDQDHNLNSIIQLLYELANNKFISKTWNVKDFPINLKTLNLLLKRLPSEPDLLFIFGNIDYAIAEQERKKITNIIRKMKSFPSPSERVWRILIFYAGNDKLTNNNIRTNIIKSKSLWNGGFLSKGSVTSANNYISLYKLRKTKSGHGIEWSKLEAITIYKRMVEEVEKIEAYFKIDRETHRYKSILEEMVWFLEFENPKLIHLQNYTEVTEKVKLLYAQQKQYSDLLSGLISHEDSKVIWAINEVSYELYNYKNFEHQDGNLKVILNKILLKSPGGLAATFGTLSDWLVAFRDEGYFKQHASILESILEIYTNESTDDFDAPFLEEKLIKIAFTLHYWGHSSMKITETLNLIENSRFNTTLITLKYILYGPDPELE